MTISSLWMWIAVILVVGVVLNLWQGSSAKKSDLDAVKWQLGRLQERIDVARKFYLETLQRELANIALSENVEAFEAAFHWMRDWQHEVEKSGRQRRVAEHNLLLEKFANLEDFDLVGTQHFIRYDHRPTWSIEQVIERYKEISKFLLVDEGQTSILRRAYSEQEVHIFREEIQSYKDLRLRRAIEEGMKRYFIWKKGRQLENPNEVYEDSEYGVQSLLGMPNREFTPEVEWGVFCKKLNEYGLESVREHYHGLHSFRSMRRMEASLRKARPLRLRHSQSLASLRHRPSQAKVRSTIQRFGRTTNWRA